MINFKYQYIKHFFPATILCSMKIILGIITVIFIGGFIFYEIDPPLNKASQAYKTWAKKHDLDLEITKNYQEKILKDDFKFERLELIEVSPGEKYYTWWGHLLLRFVGSSASGNPEEDYALSFLADFNDYPVDKWKASVGGYVVMPKIALLSEYRNEYIKNEKRSMKFYKMNSDRVQNQRLLITLRTWINKPETPGTYNFFTNNCAILMNKILVEAKILKEKGLYGYWPKYIPAHYFDVGVLEI